MYPFISTCVIGSWHIAPIACTVASLIALAAPVFWRSLSVQHLHLEAPAQPNRSPNMEGQPHHADDPAVPCGGLRVSASIWAAPYQSPHRGN
jgi:hypothetical protein